MKTKTKVPHTKAGKGLASTKPRRVKRTPTNGREPNFADLPKPEELSALETLRNDTAAATRAGDCQAVFAALTGSDAPPPTALCALLELYKAQRDNMRDIQVRLRDVGTLLYTVEQRPKERVEALLKGTWQGFQESMLSVTNAAVEALTPFQN